MNSNEEVHVIGAGGHAKVVISTLQAVGYNPQAIFDDDPKKWGMRLLEIPVVGPLSEFERSTSVRAVIAIGDNARRRFFAERLQKTDWVTVVHPHAYVHTSVQLGPGTVVFAGAVIQPDTIVGAHCIINTGATVDHDCVIGDYVHLAPGTHLAGEVQLGEGVFGGIGSVITPRVKIDSWTTVGAGGVVVRDLPARVVAIGIPAKPINPCPVG